MNASELMTRDVQSCHADDTLQRAVQIMWEHDCGVVPVVDADGRVIGMITDRDAAVSAYTKGRALWQIRVGDAMARMIHGVREEDELEAIEALMRHVKVRRVPVLDAEGRLKGILSMNDIARHVLHGGRRGDGLRADSIVKTLAAICEPRGTVVAAEAKPAARSASVRTASAPAQH